MDAGLLTAVLLALLGLVSTVQAARLVTGAQHHISASGHHSSNDESCNEPDEVCALPGFSGKLPVRMRAGYIAVGDYSGRQLWYTVVDREGPGSASENDPDPVILWLTGGPGCSSLDAFIYEHGPFKFSYDAGKGAAAAGSEQRIVLQPNPYSWSKLATMVYVDSPAGTGFSFTPGVAPDGEYHTNDEDTIADLGLFMERLWAKYPELAGRELYVAGESYGGVFVPLLAQELLRRNTEAHRAGREKPFNLQGYMVGNAVTDDAVDGNAPYQFAADMGYMDPDTWQRLRAACQDRFWDAQPDTTCFRELSAYKEAIKELNRYSVLEPCTSTPTQPHEARRPATAWALGAGEPLVGHSVPCADRRIALEWLNQPEVRAALRAAPLDTLPDWQPCSDVLRYHFSTISLVTLHEAHLREGLRVLAYSGDHDMVVPHTGTRQWVYSMEGHRGQEAPRPFGPWYMDGQVAGFMVRFPSGLVYATVKGGAHMVPQSHPAAALELMERFILEDGI